MQPKFENGSRLQENRRVNSDARHDYKSAHALFSGNGAPVVGVCHSCIQKLGWVCCQVCTGKPHLLKDATPVLRLGVSLQAVSFEDWNASASSVSSEFFDPRFYRKLAEVTAGRKRKKRGTLSSHRSDHRNCIAVER